jgi:hypothetical protein
VPCRWKEKSDEEGKGKRWSKLLKISTKSGVSVFEITRASYGGMFWGHCFFPFSSSTFLFDHGRLFEKK